MKKSFYDIMDNYSPKSIPEEYKVSSKNVKNLAMRKILNEKETSKRKHISIKRIVAIASAASIALVIGIGVVAYETGAFEKAQSFFTKNNLTVLDAPRDLEESDIAAIDTNLNEESLCVQSNGTSIELTGSMYDDQAAYLFFKMTAPTDVTFDQESYEFEDFMFELNSQQYGSAGSGIEFNDNDLTDNVTYFTYVLNYSQEYHAEDFTEIHFQNLIKVGSKGGINPIENIIDGEWDIPLNFSQPVDTIELINEPVSVICTDVDCTDNAKTVNLNSVIISPLSIKINATIDGTGGKVYNGYYDDSMFLVMKDGSTYNEIECFTFGKPIDLSNVAYLSICGQKLTVNS